VSCGSSGSEGEALITGPRRPALRKAPDLTAFSPDQEKKASKHGHPCSLLEDYWYQLDRANMHYHDVVHLIILTKKWLTYCRLLIRP